MFDPRYRKWIGPFAISALFIASAAYAQPPGALSFERNAGQTDARVRFLARTSGAVVFLTPAGVTTSMAGVTSRMDLAGANPQPEIIGIDELSEKSNYFIGNDPRRWRSGVPHYAGVRYRNVYPEIDLLFHGSEKQMEYDFAIAPGADPGTIRLRFEPAGALSIDDSGNLIIRTGGVHLIHKRPDAYQEIGGVRRRVPARYTIAVDGTVRFAVGTYDPAHALIIDPVVVYSTFLGGTSDDEGTSVAVDGSGYAYVTGKTQSIDFPTFPSTPLQVNNAGQADVFVTKLNPLGSHIIYSTYLGGAQDDVGFGIAVDSGGAAYVTGFTQSSDFPVKAPSGATPLQPTFRGAFDAFVAKLRPSGDALVYSTYLGGTSADIGRGIAVDTSGNACVAGFTYSSNFPTRFPLQGALKGTQDAFVAKINQTGTGFLFSTFLGGSQQDRGYGIALDSANDMYVTGTAQSSDFPVKSPDPNGPAQPVNAGNVDGFVVRLRFFPLFSPPLLTQIYGTFLGASNTDAPAAIAVDAGKNAYVTGETSSMNFPITPGAVQPNFAGGILDAFVTKLNPGGSSRLYSTYLGGDDTDTGTSIAVTSSGLATVTGWTVSTNFPVKKAIQPAKAGFQDAFVTQLNSLGTSYIYSTFFGGAFSDVGNGVALGGSATTVVTGQTMSSSFPVSSSDPAGPFQPSIASAFPGNDAFVFKLGLTPLFIAPTNGIVQASQSPDGNDRFYLAARMQLDPRANTIDLASEDVVITLGDFSQAIPGGSFVRFRDSFFFASARPGLKLVQIQADGTIQMVASDLEVGPLRVPGSLAFELQIGDDFGRAEVMLDASGRVQPQNR